jgi:hypothetical protein
MGNDSQGIPADLFHLLDHGRLRMYSVRDVAAGEAKSKENEP